MIALPTYIDVELWVAFCEMRKSMGKRVPFTDYAQKLILKELMQFHADGYDANSALKQSIMKGWRGVFRGELRQATNAIDPVLVKISEDSKKAAPAPAYIREQLASLTKKLTA